MIVHQAADAARALKIVLEITTPAQRQAGRQIQDHGQRGDRPEPALEASRPAGGGDRPGRIHRPAARRAPAHIITPAVHLRRQDVGQTFHEKLGDALHRGYPHH